MRILVTGGAGFIGSHVVDAYLEAGHEVGVLDDLSTGARENVNPRVRFWQIDIRSDDCPGVIADFRPEVISHHAAQMSVGLSAKDPKWDADINILGTLNVLEAAIRANTRRIIFSSTGGAMYGDEAPLPAAESTYPMPVSPYGVAKLAVERYLHAYRFMHGLESVALRYANVYGPRQNPHGEAGVVAIFCRAILDGRPLTVNGDGLQTRDYVYVADVVRANVAALQCGMRNAECGMPSNAECGMRNAECPDGIGVTDSSPAGSSIRHPASSQSGSSIPHSATHCRIGNGFPGIPHCIYNVGTGREASVLDLVTELQRTAGRKLDVRHGPPRPGEQRRSVLDSTLAGQALDWKPTVALSDGLALTYEWFRQQAHTAKP